MVRPEPALLDLERTPGHREGLVVVAPLLEQQRQVVQAVRDQNVVGSERRLADLERLNLKPHGFVVVTHLPVHDGQIAHGLGHVGVLRAPRRLQQRQRLLVEPLRLGVLSEESVIAGERGQTVRDHRIVGRQQLAPDLQ